MNVSVKVTKTASGSDIVYISTISDRTILKPGSVKLCYGSFQLPVEVKKKALSTNELILTKSLADKLFLKDNQKLQLRVTSEGNLRLGPLIGYFISIDKIKEIKLGNFDSIYETVLDTARTLGGEAFLFSIADIDWTNSKITGYTYSRDYPGKLLTSTYHLPLLIYNRCFGSGSANQIRQLLTGIKKDVIVTNTGTINPRQLTTSRHHEFKPVQILGCPIEARILVQRDFEGKWQYSAGVISLNSSIKPRGYFRSYPLECGLRDAFPADFQRVKNNLMEQAVKGAEKLGNNLPALAELEFRFELDRAGQARIKKINERPLKQYAVNFKGALSAYLAATRPMHYCFKLAGFPLTQEPRPSVRPVNADNRPLIGIFEEPCEMTDIKAQKVGNYQLFLARASAELGCTTYHFSVNELRETNCIEGWYYDPAKQKWLQKQFPWPQVFYDRATFPYTSQREEAKKLRKLLKRYGSTIFLNTKSVFGKGYTSDILAKMPFLQNYLPFNVVNPSSARVKELLNTYSSVFIKTEHGSNLAGVLKITKKQGTYLMSGKYENTSFPNFKQLWLKISNMIKTDPFVAQEGISPAIYRSQPLNIRTIVQKNGDGIWEVSLVKPWIATTPEIRGFPLKWNEAMIEVFSSPEKAASIHAEMCKVSLAVAKTLEAHIGRLGELGIDLVVDSSGHPWIIEVNGKTNKIFFLRDEKPENYYRLYYNPLAYGRFLARNYSY